MWGGSRPNNQHVYRRWVSRPSRQIKMCVVWVAASPGVRAGSCGRCVAAALWVGAMSCVRAGASHYGPTVCHTDLRLWHTPGRSPARNSRTARAATPTHAPPAPYRSCAARVAVVLAAEVQVNSISGLSPPKEKKRGGVIAVLVTGLLLTDPDDFSRTKAH